MNSPKVHTCSWKSNSGSCDARPPFYHGHHIIILFAFYLVQLGFIMKLLEWRSRGPGFSLEVSFDKILQKPSLLLRTSRNHILIEIKHKASKPFFATRLYFAGSVDQDQTAQDTQCDLGTTLFYRNISFFSKIPLK